ncbi:MAG: Mur ligase family protein [Candidatus Gottesmanbacteria bacterium]|nr:Mur ligase family protein [Candidatus Gottesmanbacteria bacterium]
MSWFDSIIATNAKTLSKISTTLRLGAGATWPGEIALTVKPNILSSLLSGLRKGIIIVAGTNGKTTTARMIVTILEAQGLRVIHNASGANLLNGIVSALINKADWRGQVSADWGVFEVDENSLPQFIKSIKSIKSKVVLVLLNLFRDQLDRYGEVDVISEKWQKSLESLNNVKIIANADDPLIAYLASSASRPGPSFAQATAGRLEASTRFFGLDDPSQFQKKIEHATDSTFCPTCGTRLLYEGYYYSHIGIWKCIKCKTKRPPLDVSECDYPLPGLYNRYNTLAAVAASQVLDIKQETISEALAGFVPAFGRQEEFTIDGKKVKIFLSKNPTGFNQSLRTILDLGAKHLLLVLNDRIPDGRDVSWIWDVDFELLTQDEHVITVSGDRVYDLALRLKYANLNQFFVEPNLHHALKQSLDVSSKSETLYILATYSAMLDVRKLLTGRKIL